MGGSVTTCGADNPALGRGSMSNSTQFRSHPLNEIASAQRKAVAGSTDGVKKRGPGSSSGVETGAQPNPTSRATVPVGDDPVPPGPLAWRGLREDPPASGFWWSAAWVRMVDVTLVWVTHTLRTSTRTRMRRMCQVTIWRALLISAGSIVGCHCMDAHGSDLPPVRPEAIVCPWHRCERERVW